MNLPDFNKCKIAIIGLGYVGLPLAIEFAKNKKCQITNRENNNKVMGFDIDKNRIKDLKNGIDLTNELKNEDLRVLKKIELTNDPKKLKNNDVFIISVPTPIDKFNNPNTKSLRDASHLIGKIIKEFKNDLKIKTPIIIYESTVYPGATEELCIPIIEKESCLKLNEDFLCGYSPERINPGDKVHGLKDIVKVTSGSNEIASEWINSLYSSVLDAGTHKAKSIKVAEAAKIIENTQRDLNIALINELAIICSLLKIDTLDVIEAASTKWNFIKFKPGLVGGHCIGVDPYYLTHKAEELGYHPQVVLAGRRINDGMHIWIAQKLILSMVKKGHIILNSKILILGFTFKENCPDYRNTKVEDLIIELSKYGINCTISDPLCDVEKVKETKNIKISKKVDYKNKFDGVILAVAHDEYKKFTKSNWDELITDNGILFDLQGLIPIECNPIRI